MHAPATLLPLAVGGRHLSLISVGLWEGPPALQQLLGAVLGLVARLPPVREVLARDLRTGERGVLPGEKGMVNGGREMGRGLVVWFQMCMV